MKYIHVTRVYRLWKVPDVEYHEINDNSVFFVAIIDEEDYVYCKLYEMNDEVLPIDNALCDLVYRSFVFVQLHVHDFDQPLKEIPVITEEYIIDNLTKCMNALATYYYKIAFKFNDKKFNRISQCFA